MTNLLSPLGNIYGKRARLRGNAPPKWRAPVPVICVGSATVGGSGKTPLARTLRRLLREKFREPTLVLRGYGGSAERPVVLRRGQGSAAIAGDEAVLHASDGLTIVSANRITAARLALDKGADLIIMDDGLHNRDLVQDVRILTVAVNEGFGNAKCLPAGPLRAPLEHTLNNSDIIVGIGERKRGDWLTALGERHGLQVFFGDTRLSGLTSAMMARPAVAYAGIAFPQRFFESLKKLGLNLVHTEALGDHELPSRTICNQLLKVAEMKDAVIVTTAKDKVRLAGRGGAAEKLYLRSHALEYSIGMAEEDLFITALLSRIVASRAPHMPPQHQSTPPVVR